MRSAGSTINRALLFLVLCGTILAESHARQSGLLLGVATQEEVRFGYDTSGGYAQRLRTYWLVPGEDAMRQVIEVPQLIVPRESGFWKVGLKRSIYNYVVEDFLWSLPTDEVATVRGIDPVEGEACDELSTIAEVMFVGADHLSVNIYGGGYCEGNAHPSGWNDYYWTWHDSLRSAPDAYEAFWRGPDLETLLGTEAYRTFQEEGRRVWDGLDPRKRMALDSLPRDLHLVRKQGRWTSVGRLHWSAEVVRGVEEYFDSSVEPPRRLVGHDQRAVPWDSVLARVPRANDAFTSPTRDLLVILERGKLHFFSIRDGRIDSAPMTVHGLIGGMKVIMIQWAVGPHVERWTQELQRIQASVHRWRRNQWREE